MEDQDRPRASTRTGSRLSVLDRNKDDVEKSIGQEGVSEDM